MTIDPQAGLALAALIGIAAPCVGHTIMRHLDKLADAKVAEGQCCRALELQEHGMAAHGVGWAVAGMMAMALMLAPFMPA
jgi:hypothetical protein